MVCLGVGAVLGVILVTGQICMAVPGGRPGLLCSPLFPIFRLIEEPSLLIKADSVTMPDKYVHVCCFSAGFLQPIPKTASTGHGTRKVWNPGISLRTYTV